MSVLIIMVALANAANGSQPGNSCNRPDPELIHCPSPDAPRITELGAGKVTLELEVGPNGEVQGSKVISSSGHRAWQGAAQEAVAKWRYSAGSTSRVRVVPFDFRLGE